MFTKISVATLFAGLAAAQLHAPVGEPAGNPILRPLNEIVPACKPFTIVWQPTTPNTVSVLLLKGPATNVVKFGPALAEGIANSGSLVFTPSADLEATTGPNGYGIQIIDDVTGQYQYSTQFGFSKGDCAAVVSSSALVASSAAPASSSAAGGYPVGSSTHAASSKATPSPYSTASPINTIAPYPTHTLTTSAYGTGVPHGNSTVIPTKSVSASGAPSASGNATTSRLPEATTNAASSMQVGISFAGLAAAVAFIL